MDLNLSISMGEEGLMKCKDGTFPLTGGRVQREVKKPYQICPKQKQSPDGVGSNLRRLRHVDRQGSCLVNPRFGRGLIAKSG